MRGWGWDGWLVYINYGKYGCMQKRGITYSWMDTNSCIGLKTLLSWCTWIGDKDKCLTHEILPSPNACYVIRWLCQETFYGCIIIIWRLMNILTHMQRLVGWWYVDWTISLMPRLKSYNEKL